MVFKFNMEEERKQWSYKTMKPGTIKVMLWEKEWRSPIFL
jgi:hypothetical protein